MSTLLTGFVQLNCFVAPHVALCTEGAMVVSIAQAWTQYVVFPVSPVTTALGNVPLTGAFKVVWLVVTKLVLGHTPYL